MKIKQQRFVLGEIWKSPRGILYKVIGFRVSTDVLEKNSAEIEPKQAILRRGSLGTGRIKYVDYDAVEGWIRQ